MDALNKIIREKKSSHWGLETVNQKHRLVGPSMSEMYNYAYITKYTMLVDFSRRQGKFQEKRNFENRLLRTLTPINLTFFG